MEPHSSSMSVTDAPVDSCDSPKNTNQNSPTTRRNFDEMQRRMFKLQ